MTVKLRIKETYMIRNKDFQGQSEKTGKGRKDGK
jgi:hypothetical protein